MAIDPAAVRHHVEAAWDDEILPALHEYIRIPNVSPDYAPDWAESGHMATAVELVRAWLASRLPEGATIDVHELPGRTPVVLVDIPATDGSPGDEDTVLLYGHLDKQPPMTGWREGLGPWQPVLEDDRLYGRGGADDGYAAFAALAAVAAVRAAGGQHRRVVLVVEASEESGSPDLPAHLDALGDRIGAPGLVVCLDSEATTWDRLWLTTSLRGLVQARVTVQVLEEGAHSGLAGGIVPSSFRILRSLLDRVEDAATGRVRLPEAHVSIPDERRHQVRETAPAIPDLVSQFAWVQGAGPDVEDPAALLLANTWEPSLEVTGLAGAPPPEEAGNVLRPSTSAALSLRLPPTADAEAAGAALRTALASSPPHGARVSVDITSAQPGWAAPATAPWLGDAVDTASAACWGKPSRAVGIGGSIPFMAMLGERFPDTQFVITGVLGPGSNAHGPNEYLHVPTGKRVTAAVALLLDAHAARSR